MKVLLTVIALNLLLVDFAAVSADYKLREFRDAACSELQPFWGNPLPRPLPDPNTPKGMTFYLSTQDRTTYELMNIYVSDTGGRWRESLHLYGCDAKGHRYRMWVQRSETK